LTVSAENIPCPASDRTTRSVAHNSLLNGVGSLLPLLVGVLAIPYTIHGLGTARFGILSLAWMVLGYFTMFDLGLGRSATRFLAEALSANQRYRVPSLFWSAIVLQVAFALILVGFLLPYYSTLVRRFVGVAPALLPETSVVVLLVIVSIPVIQLATAFRGIVESTQRFDLVNIICCPSNCATFLIPVLAIHFGCTLPAIVVLLLLNKLLGLLAYAVCAFIILPEAREFRLPRWLECKQLFGFGGWVTVSSVLGPLFNYFERLVIISYLSIEMFAYYSAPLEMLGKTVVIASSVSAALFPIFSGYKSTVYAATDTFIRPLKYVLWVMSALAIILVGTATPLLSIWLGQNFGVHGAQPFRILTLAFLLNGLTYIPWSAILGLNRPEWKAKLDLCQLPIYVALCLIVIPRYGLPGAAICRLVFTGVDFAWLLFLGMRLLGLRSREIRSKLGSSAILSVAAISTTLLLAFCGFRSVQTFVGAVAIAAVYICSVVWLATDETDRNFAAKVWKRMAFQVR